MSQETHNPSFSIFVLHFGGRTEGAALALLGNKLPSVRFSAMPHGGAGSPEAKARLGAWTFARRVGFSHSEQLLNTIAVLGCVSSDPDLEIETVYHAMLGTDINGFIFDGDEFYPVLVG